MAKESKAEVNYSHGNRAAHCGICAHYQAAEHKCKLVSGQISPLYWCRLFKRATAGELMARMRRPAALLLGASSVE